MSIATRKGDDGTTGLMYNKRVPKSHPRVAAMGTVDELNAAIGMARALNGPGFVGDNLLIIQKDLVTFMGEMATLPEDLERYGADGFQIVAPELTAKLDKLVAERRAVTRRGMERVVQALRQAEELRRALDNQPAGIDAGASGDIQNVEMIVFLNRLSDVLWLMARWVETKGGLV